MQMANAQEYEIASFGFREDDLLGVNGQGITERYRIDRDYRGLNREAAGAPL